MKSYPQMFLVELFFWGGLCYNKNNLTTQKGDEEE